MKNKKKGKIDFLILGIITFIVLLLISSVTWVKSEWDNVDFSTIMFQMHTPLAGTNSEIIYSYVARCIPQTIIGTLAIVSIYQLLKGMSRKLEFTFDITFFAAKAKVKVENKIWMRLSRIYFGSLTTIYCIICYTNVKNMGVFDYFNNISNKSTVFEEQYIDPRTVVLKFPENKRNLILIYLESMESTYASVEYGGGKSINYIPNLTELAQKNVSFSGTDKLGGGKISHGCGWTTGAVLGTSSGVPFKSTIEGNSMSEYAEFLPGLITLGDMLEAEGYSNYFMCGSDAEFGGRKLFYEKHGNYQIQDYFYAKEQGYIPKDYHVFWGYEDEKLFAIAKVELDKLGNSGELFNYTMLTVDTHHPEGYICELCENKYTEPYANAIACSDRQVAEFVSWIEEQEWYKNTTIILIGDHTSMAAGFWNDIGNYDRRTYNCFLNLPEGLNLDNVKNREFDTLDYFPTILASLDVKIEGERLGLGTNLFSKKQTLLEELGEEYEEELKKYSEYYVENFERNH